MLLLNIFYLKCILTGMDVSGLSPGYPLSLEQGPVRSLGHTDLHLGLHSNNNNKLEKVNKNR